jgi:PTH1 family peptidyl-tRNA hydrolase
MSGPPALPDSASSTKKIFCIAGLGNPGERYSGTPHNIGFAVVDELAARHGIRISRRDSLSLSGTGKIGDVDVVLIKPQTFMNNSGAGVLEALKYRSLTNQNLIVVHDELDLPWPGLRIKENGSAAGHNGVKSIIGSLKTETFTRVRVGIRPNHPVSDAAKYVLSPLERELKVDEEEVVSYTADAIELLVAEGAEKAMAKFNRRARGMTNEEE